MAGGMSMTGYGTTGKNMGDSHNYDLKINRGGSNHGRSIQEDLKMSIAFELKMATDKLK
jgi:hypothetical protein